MTLLSYLNSHKVYRDQIESLIIHVYNAQGGFDVESTLD